MATLAAPPPTHPDAPRLDRIEALAYADIFHAAPSALAAAAGIAADTHGDLLLLRVAAMPGDRTFNRAMGLAAPGADVEEDLDRVRRFFAGAPHVLALHGAAGDDARAAVARRGYRDDYAWDKFDRPAADPAPAPTDLTLREATPADALAAGAVVAAAFGAPDAVAAWVAALVGRPHWHVVIAQDGDTPVAAAALFVAERTGWLGLGATLPSHRGRGAQGAMFAARIRAAAEQGCDIVVTETGTPGPDGPGPSYRNMLRAGLVPRYRRANLRSPG